MSFAALLSDYCDIVYLFDKNSASLKITFSDMSFLFMIEDDISKGIPFRINTNSF